MGVAAILVMWPRPREQTFIPPSHWGSIWNLALIGFGEKIFENGGPTTDTGPCLYYKLTSESKGSGELIIPISYNPCIMEFINIMTGRQTDGTIHFH